jgi:hypothetical protein
MLKSGIIKSIFQLKKVYSDYFVVSAMHFNKNWESFCQFPSKKIKKPARILIKFILFPEGFSSLVLFFFYLVLLCKTLSLYSLNQFCFLPPTIFWGSGLHLSVFHLLLSWAPISFTLILYFILLPFFIIKNRNESLCKFPKGRHS